MNQLKVGTVLSYLKMLISVVVGLIYVPLILKYLSISQYGLYQLVASFVAYLAILDFGLSGTITRFYSQKMALDDEKGQQSVIAVSLIIYTAISFLILLVGFIIYSIMGGIYGAQLTTNEIATAKTMLVLLIIDVALMVPSHVFTAIITAHEKFVFLRLSSIVRNILQPFLVVFLLKSYPKALSLVIIQIILDITIILITILYAFRALRIRIHLHTLDKPLAKQMIFFSFFIFLNLIVDQVYWGTGQLILGAVVGTASVAIYSIAIQFSNYFRQFSTAILSVLLPKIARIASVSDDMEEINRLFIKIGRIQYLILGLLLSGFIVFGKTFISLWIGDEFSLAYTMTLVIMVPFALDLTTSMGNLVLQAKNLHSRRSIILSFTAILNVLLTITLSNVYGELGAATAVGISLLLGNGIAMFFYYEKIGLHLTRLFKALSPLIATTVILIVAGISFTKVIKIDSWVAMSISAVLYAFIYTIIIWILGLNREEKLFFLSFMRRTNR